MKINKLDFFFFFFLRAGRIFRVIVSVVNTALFFFPVGKNYGNRVNIVHEYRGENDIVLKKYNKIQFQ